MKNDIATALNQLAAAASSLVEADPYLVAFSPTNPRKRRGLDIESLSALATSIKTQGLAQPILVRPLPGSRAEETFRERGEGQPLPAYELVCGERRLRASRLAELAAIPMLVRDLSDDAALELQLVENIEREDLDPIEEAEGFELLRTKLGYSVEQIAERIGRGRGPDYVRKTTKLLALTPASRQALEDGHLGRSTALLVSRYPAEQQAEVVAFIRNHASNGEPMPYRSIAPKVFVRFNLELKKAVWSIEDAALVPAAGACTACPKRTGAHADLFGDDANSPDSCTDPDCFESKRAAHVEQVKIQAAKDGFKVIDGEEAKAAVPSPFARYIDGFERLDAVAYTEPGADGQERQVTYGDALRSMGKKAPKPRILINPHTGEAVKVITSDLADKLLESAPKDDEPGTAGRGRQPPVDERPDDLRALDVYDVRRAVLLRVFQAVRARDRTDAEVLLMAKTLFALQDWELPQLCTFLNWDGDLEGVDYGDLEGVITGKLDALPAAEVAAIATMAAIETALHTLGEGNAMALQLAKAYGVDVLAVRDKVAQDLGREVDADDEDVNQAEENSLESPEAGLLSNVHTDDPDTSIGSDEETADTVATEPRAHVGARVRIKDDLKGRGHRRKISGREGVLLSNPQGDDWMFKADGAKEKARVSRDEFVLLQPAGEDDGGAIETRNWPLPAPAKIDPAAAWPFPKKGV